MRPARIASYRLQLTPSFGFDAARRQLDRLTTLGISHVYLSPVTEAIPGSTHGYDVVDHTAVRAELGGIQGLTALLDALADRGMAAVVDHVANHCSIARPELNGPWWALLRDGPGSAAADRWFDIDWAAGDGQILLPVLDRLDVDDDVRLEDGCLLVAGGTRLPLTPGTEQLDPVDALARQHYRLIHWRRPERNVRRFFTIDSLVAVRVEHPEVAAAVDTVPRLLVEHPAFDGVRVDHIDGIADPQAYLGGLRELLGDRWLIVEKILAPDEQLVSAWPADGTTGYDHARALEHALVDRRGWWALAERWSHAVADDRPFEAWELESRREVLDDGLRPDRDRVARVASAVVPESARDAVTELSVHLGRYRTYLPDDEDGRRAMDAAASSAAATRPDLSDSLDRLVEAIATNDELRVRWQQLTGPAAAKGVEDRALWRYLPLASLGEVGGVPAPEIAVDGVVALHRHHEVTSDRWPTTMLAGSTHDAARSEDVRAFGLALSATASSFARLWDLGSFADADPAAAWLALQTVITAPGLSVERLSAFLVKAAREAHLRTSWTDPDGRYEEGLDVLARAMSEWPPAVVFAEGLDRSGRATALAMLAVRATAPGVLDVYQGGESFRFLLVDPDNRVPADHGELDEVVRRAVLVDGREAWADPFAPLGRAVVLMRLLTLRRSLRDVFGPRGGYQALDAEAGVVAFARLDPMGAPQVITAVAGPGVTGGRLVLPGGPWRHVLVDDEPPVEGRLDLTAALEMFPAVVLVSSDTRPARLEL